MLKTAASNPSSGSNPTVATDGTKPTGDTCGPRASLSTCIKTLESTLSALPAGGPSESTRLYLHKEISEKKREITESKPLAIRLASCKGAVDRAAAKRLACQEVVERAIQEFQKAQVRERELGEELASLERQLSEQCSAVQPNMVEEARRHMEQLFMSLTTLSQQSQAAIMVQGSRFCRCYSAAKCQFLFLERGAQTGQILWAPIWRDSANRLLGQRSVGERYVARCADGGGGQSMAPSSSIRFERKEKATCCGKRKSHKTVVIAIANVGTLRPGGLTRLNASSRCVTPRCEELSVKFADAVMSQETRLQVKEIASTSKYDLSRPPANEQGSDGTHVWLDKDAGFTVQASVAQKDHGCNSEDLWHLLGVWASSV